MAFPGEQLNQLQAAEQFADKQLRCCVEEIAAASRSYIGGNSGYNWADDAEDALREAIAAVVTVEMMKKFGAQ